MNIEKMNVALGILWALQASLIWIIGPENIADGLEPSAIVGVSVAGVLVPILSISCLLSAFKPNVYLDYVLVACGAAWGGGAILSAIEQAYSPVDGVNVAWVVATFAGGLSLFVGLNRLPKRPRA